MLLIVSPASDDSFTAPYREPRTYAYAIAERARRAAIAVPRDLNTREEDEMAISVPPGASITSRDSGSDVDHVRTAILALQMYAEGLHDDQELQVVHRCITQLQGILAAHAKDRAAAMGESPALRHVRRTTRGAGY
jgi:hypothetical protein